MPWTETPTDPIRELGPVPADPEQMNEARAEWAGEAVDTFQAATGTDRCDALSDLLCDLMHLCDRDGRLQDFDSAVERARRSYTEETLDEPIDEVDASQVVGAGWPQRVRP